jgi:hypothetical protein
MLQVSVTLQDLSIPTPVTPPHFIVFVSVKGFTRMRMFENRVPEIMYGCKGHEGIGR